MTVIYDRSFNANEWFVIINIVVLVFLIWITPKIFTILEGTAHFLIGVAIGLFFDHTISVKPWDFYDVNDDSSYQLLDFLSYIMYGPYSYFFIYGYEKFNIKGYSHIPYVFFWGGFAVLMEWIGIKVGLFHYDKGFNMYWSFPIYILTLTIQIIFYHVIKKEMAKNKECKR
ncbi:hypothetical protein ACJ2A9_00770 [Anaerobacillus sp. MEB173]|uniref:hypothetical protein n=1 Tax=Anaerobacillus sp. MEB173 TaxID=3383345 RepID=UPI003F920583